MLQRSPNAAYARGAGVRLIPQAAGSSHASLRPAAAWVPCAAAGMCGESRAEPGAQPGPSRAAGTLLVIKSERTDRKRRSWT